MIRCICISEYDVGIAMWPTLQQQPNHWYEYDNFSPLASSISKYQEKCSKKMCFTRFDKLLNLHKSIWFDLNKNFFF